jgi:hypothetical protein
MIFACFGKKVTLGAYSLNLPSLTSFLQKAISDVIDC